MSVYFPKGIQAILNDSIIAEPVSPEHPRYIGKAGMTFKWDGKEVFILTTDGKYQHFAFMDNDQFRNFIFSKI